MNRSMKKLSPQVAMVCLLHHPFSKYHLVFKPSSQKASKFFPEICTNTSIFMLVFIVNYFYIFKFFQNFNTQTCTKKFQLLNQHVRFVKINGTSPCIRKFGLILGIIDQNKDHASLSYPLILLAGGDFEF